MKYFIVNNGQQAGPFELHELLANGLNANSYVWCEGMPNWLPATQVPEVAALLQQAPPPPGFHTGFHLKIDSSSCFYNSFQLLLKKVQLKVTLMAPASPTVAVSLLTCAGTGAILLITNFLKPQLPWYAKLFK